MTRPPLRGDLDRLPRYVAGRPPAADGFKLSSNELPVPPAAGVVDAAASTLSSLNRYPEVTGATLCERLAAHLEVPVEQVVVAGGSIAVLQQLIQAVVEPGRAVVFGWRSYEAYPILVRVAHGRPVEVPLREHRHDLEAMVRAMHQHDAAMVLVCNPNNPTGTVVDTEELTDFLDAVPPQCLVVLDEAYREFVTDGAVPDGLRVAEGRENVVVLRTFSKAHGLAGARVGYGIAPSRVADAVRAVALPFTLSSIAAAAALAALDEWPRQSVVVDEACRARDSLVTRLRSAGLPVPDSQANFVWIPEVGLPDGWVEELDRRGVSVRRFAGDGLRVTVGEPEGLAVLLESLSTRLVRSGDRRRRGGRTDWG
jgi:histidinol-phosphate aminotransferase